MPHASLFEPAHQVIQDRMMPEIQITLLEHLPHGLEDLERESVEQGFTMLTRLRDDWTSGVNRFNRPGEALYGAFRRDRLVGIGGLNIDPYLNDPAVARLRHLYVHAEDRRHGVGRSLAERLLRDVGKRFDSVRLWTGQAASFYEALGFEAVEELKATHRLRLPTRDDKDVT